MGLKNYTSLYRQFPKNETGFPRVTNQNPKFRKITYFLRTHFVQFSQKSLSQTFIKGEKWKKLVKENRTERTRTRTLLDGMRRATLLEPVHTHTTQTV